MSHTDQVFDNLISSVKRVREPFEVSQMAYEQAVGEIMTDDELVYLSVEGGTLESCFISRKVADYFSYKKNGVEEFSNYMSVLLGMVFQEYLNNAEELRKEMHAALREDDE